MSVQDYIVIGALIVTLFFVIRSMVKSRGKCGCSGCDGCCNTCEKGKNGNSLTKHS